MSSRHAKPPALAFPLLCMILAAASCGGDNTTASEPITLATTTTLEDSGFLDSLLAAFRSSHPDLSVRAITGGTGEVLEIARLGGVDIVLSHDSVAEAAFIRAGHGTERRAVMENDFLLVGPSDDPAGVRGGLDGPTAVRAVAGAAAHFISRGDESGTHMTELRLWALAGLSPSTGNRGSDPWYIEAGTGMAEALRVASERGAYTLTDRATFETLRDRLELDLLVEGDEQMRNRYGVVRVSRVPNPAGADTFIEWITGPEARELIADFGREAHGRPLFFPATEGPDTPDTD